MPICGRPFALTARPLMRRLYDLLRCNSRVLEPSQSTTGPIEPLRLKEVPFEPLNPAAGFVLDMEMRLCQAPKQKEHAP